MVIALLWLFTPIFYKFKDGSLHYKLNQLNPIYHFMEISRETIIYNKDPSFISIIILALISLSFFLFGYILFSINKKNIAENL